MLAFALALASGLDLSSYPRTNNHEPTTPKALASQAARRHIACMPTVILLMIFGAAAFSYWNAARAAAEHAERLGRNACSAADVILLDQTVQASGIRVRRNEDGRLGFERSFRFEYSRDGIDRQIGRLVLRGDRLVSFVGPVKPLATPINLH